MYIMDPVDRIVVSETPTTTTISSNVSPNVSLSQTSSTPLASSSSSPSSSNVNNSSATLTKDIGEKVVKKSNFWKIGKYIIIIFLLSFLGFNVFTALGKVTDKTGGILGKILGYLGYGVGETIKKTTNTAAKGAKLGVDIVANTVDDAATLIEKGTGVEDIKYNRIGKKDKSMAKALKTAEKNKQSNKNIPQPDDAMSTTQKSQNKAGYCYIGEDRGFRSCIKVGEGDQCMSGDIFPTQDICINPNLRE